MYALFLKKVIELISPSKRSALYIDESSTVSSVSLFARIRNRAWSKSDWVRDVSSSVILLSKYWIVSNKKDVWKMRLLHLPIRPRNPKLWKIWWVEAGSREFPWNRRSGSLYLSRSPLSFWLGEESHPPPPSPFFSLHPLLSPIIHRVLKFYGNEIGKSCMQRTSATVERKQWMLRTVVLPHFFLERNLLEGPFQ